MVRHTHRGQRMYQTLTTDEAAQLLKQDTNAAWTYQGARALVEYLEQV